jgi:hypothetical protein
MFLFSYPAFAWDGYDYEEGNYIEIEEGNLVREGEEIEIYDYSDGEYKYVTVEEIDSYGGTTEVEVYDYETGEYRTFEMED